MPDRNRVLTSAAAGVIITIVAFSVVAVADSQGLARILLWPARALCYRECGPDHLCEGTPADLGCAMVGLAFTAAFYASVYYAVLKVRAGWRGRA